MNLVVHSETLRVTLLAKTGRYFQRHFSVLDDGRNSTGHGMPLQNVIHSRLNRLRHLFSDDIVQRQNAQTADQQQELFHRNLTQTTR